jgi:two-component system response regulator AtoC
MLTARQDVDLVVRAFRLGARDWLQKPLRPDLLLCAIERALDHGRLLSALLLRSEQAKAGALARPDVFAELCTEDPALLRVLREAELHAASGIPVLITGETGVGKELLARGLHRASRRAAGPFVAVNMLALSPGLFEAEFFGHTRGAYTGAETARPGYLGRARGGSLFLDEIGDLSADIQGKLLRILQEDEYVPVGSSEPRRADVRVIAATNQDLQERVDKGLFRRDLLYRLQYARLHLPALRERPGDVALLAAHFLARSTRPEARLSPEAVALLRAHAWPGNVRELQGVIEAAANLAVEGVVEADLLRLLPARAAGLPPDVAAEVAPLPLAEVERRHILAVYAACGRNKTRTARALGIGLQTLHRKLAQYRDG